MKKIIMLIMAVFFVSTSAYAGTFYVQDIPGLQSSVDNALSNTTTGKARAYDSRGNKYRVQLTSQGGNCRVGVVIASNGDTASSSICVPGSRRVQNSVSMRQVQPRVRYATNQRQRSVEQQILTHGYATSMQENADVGAQYALRGYENAPYQDRQLTRVNHNGVHNMSPTEFDEYKRREDWLRKDEMVTTNVNKSAAEAAVGWTSGGYNRGYNQERYPGEHQIEKLDDWVDLANKVSRMWN